MLEGKTRIPPVDVETLPDDLRETLAEQEKLRVLTGRQCCRGQQEWRLDGEDRGAPRLCEARMQQHYDDDTIAELTMIIAWENASSRFNRAFRIPSQGFWKPA